MEEVNTEALSEAIENAQELLSNTNVGTESGEVSEDAKNALSKAIENAEAVLADEDANQAEIDGAVTTLGAAVEIFKNAIVA